MCGACTVLVDGEAVRSCLMFAVQADGAEVVDRRGAGAGPTGELSAVQEALRECHGLQCGFCTPGFVVSMTAFLERDPDRRRTTRSATRCPATCAAAPATRASSRPSALAAGRRGASDARPADAPATASSASASSGARTPASLTGHGTYVDDVVVPGHAPRGLRAQRRRPRHDHVARRRRGPRRCPASSPCSPAPTSTATSARRGSTSRAATAARPLPGARRRRRALRRRAGRARRRRVALRRRGRVRARRGRHRPDRRPSSTTTPRSPPAHAPVHPELRRQRRRRHPGGRRPRARRDLRRRRPRRHRDVPPAPLPLRADGEPGRRVELGPAAATSSSVHISTQGPHDVRGFLSRALGLPENRVRVVMQRRRRRLRAEDVHAARRARRRARRQAPRPPGQVDRGPPREPDRRPARPRGPDDRQRARSTTTAASSACAADLVEDVGAFPAAGSSAIGFVGRCSSPGRTGSRRCGSRPRAVYTNTCGPVLVPRPVDDGDRWPRADDRRRRPAGSASTRSSCGGAT